MREDCIPIEISVHRDINDNYTGQLSIGGTVIFEEEANATADQAYQNVVSSFAARMREVLNA